MRLKSINKNAKRGAFRAPPPGPYRVKNKTRGWSKSQFKADIQRSLLRTEHSLRDICDMKYLKNNSKLLANL